MNNQNPQSSPVPSSTGMPTDQTHIVPNNQTPPPPPPPQPKSINMILIVVAIILFLGILGTGSYFAYQNYVISKQPITTSAPRETTTPSTTPDSTANWKTYTNLVGRYSFKYDPVYSLKNTATAVTLDLSGNKMSVSTEPTKLTLNAYVDQKSWCKSITSKTGKAFTLDSVASLKFDKNPCGPSGSTDIYSVNNGIAYHIMIGTQENFATVEPIFNQIISTFKFTPLAIDITNWKTFSGNNFRLRLPSTWTLSQTTPNNIWDFTSKLTSTSPFRELIVTKLTTSLTQTKSDVLALFSSPPVIKTISLGGIDFTEYYGCAGVEGCTNSYIIVGVFNDSTYKIEFSGDPTDTNLYQTIISTFKFTQ